MTVFNPSSNPAPNPLDFLSGGGEMGERIRTLDWSTTPLGPPAQWPNSLKTIVRIMLTSQQPIWIGWGKDLIKLYNDPYRAIVGGKHPWALGQPASVVWRDIWEAVGPRLQKVMQSNEGTYDEALLLMMERYGYREETYYTFSYSPVPDDQGGSGGIFCANTDDTRRIIGERQLNLLRELASRTVEAKTLEGLYRQAEESLRTNPTDLPFALLYMLTEDGKSLVRKGASGITADHLAAPESIQLAEESFWPLREVIQSNQAVRVNDLPSAFPDLPTGSWSVPPRQAAVVPIAQSGHTGPAGVLMVGLNPFRLYDEGYQGFIRLLAGQLAASIADVQAFEEERKRAEALAEIDKAKTIFFSNVSHELRTPLTLMLGPLESLLAESTQLPGSIRQEVERVQRNGLRLLKLVNSLLDFARIEAGRVQAVYQPTDLARLTGELASVFRSAVEKAGLRYRLDIQHLPEPVYVDTTMWERMVFNLLSNALKFTLRGEIALSLSWENRKAILRVRDTGTGIAAAELSKLFTRFHRIEGSRGRTHEGTGIGLAMVYELAKLHGGQVGVESELGQGSLFQVEIPLGKEHLPADRLAGPNRQAVLSLNALPQLEQELGWFDAEPSPSIPDAPFIPSWEENGPREAVPDRCGVLVVDDNADMREYLQRILSAHYDVAVATDGWEALERIRGKRPHLVLSDIMMPGLDGLGLVRALRMDPQTQTLPILLLSARAGEEANVEGLESGADDYLVKPFTVRELLSRVQTHLKLARLREEFHQKERILLAETERQRQRLYALFMEAPAPICILDGPELVYELVNPAYQQLFVGRQLSGKPILEALPELQGGPIEPILRQVYQRGESFTGHEVPVRLIRQAGGEPREYFFNFIYQPRKNELGVTDGIMVFAYEVTSQVTARRLVEEQNKVLETVTSGAPLSQALTLLVESIESFSGREILGSVLLLDETGQRLLHGAAPHLPTAYNEAINGLVIGPGVGSCGTAAFTKAPVVVTDIATDPLWKDFRELALGHGLRSCWSTPILAEGKVLGTFALYGRQPFHPTEEDRHMLDFASRTASLIIERKRAEKALRESEERFRTMADAAPNIVWALNPDGTQKYINRYGLNYLGLSLEEALAHGWSPYVYPDDVKPTEEAVSWAIRHQKLYSQEMRLRSHTGEYRWFLSQGAPSFYANGELYGYVGSGTDITERKEAERQMQALAQELAAANEEIQSSNEELQANNEELSLVNQRLIKVNTDLDNFVYAASHDLKSPVTSLSALLGFLQKRLEGKLDEKGVELLKMIEASSARLQRTIRDLTQVAKVQRNTDEEKETVSFTELWQDIQGDLQMLVLDSGAQLKVDFQEDSLLYARQNARSILYNLVSNAIKYRSPDRLPEVRVSTRALQGKVVLTVRDNGLGLSADQQRSLFTMFKRFHNHVEGSGVGLYMIKRMVENNGGRIEVESWVGVGTTFLVYF